MLRVFLFALLMLAAPPALADRDSPHDFLTNDDKARTWLAVGRLEINGRRMCTGALISPKIVLTAAHCLVDKRSGAPVKAMDVVFKAGYRRGRSAAEGRGKRFILHEKYDHRLANTALTIPHDVAVLELQSPIADLRVRPFLLHRKPGKDDKVMVVSYARGRAEIPALEDGCRMTGYYGKTLSYDCDLNFGSSGAPVFVMTTQGPKITSIITSGTRRNGNVRAFGAPLEGTLQSLLTRLAASDPESKFVRARETGATVKRRSLAEQLGRSDPNQGLSRLSR